MISSAKQKEERNADVMMTMMKILQLDLLNVGHNQSQKCVFFFRTREWEWEMMKVKLLNF